MNRFLFLGRAAVVLAACVLSLAGCSGGGLTGDLVTGQVIGGADAAKVRIDAALTNVEAEGGKISVEVSNAGGGEMNWSASLSANWAKFEGESKGDGTGTLTVAFKANTETEDRTITLSISSREASNSPQTVVFTQAGAEPEPKPVLNASADNYALEAGGGRIAVTLANDGGGELEWSASLPSDASWVRFIGKSSGLGPSNIQIEVDSNSTKERRSFTLTVTADSAGQSPQTLHFTQEGGAEPAADSFEISAVSYEVGSEGGSVRVTVTAAAGVQWSAAFGGNSDWIHFSGPSSGTGNGSITVRIQSNTAQESRSFALTVTAESSEQAPQTLHFTQEGGAEPAADSFEISAVSYKVGSEGGSVRVTVTAAAGVQWSAAFGGNADWIHFSGPSNGTGNGSITVRIQSNTAQESRSFALTVTAESSEQSPQTLHFTQEGGAEPAADSFEISAVSYKVGSEGGSVRVTVTAAAGVQWSAAFGGNADWIHFSGPSSGTGNGSVTVRVQGNTARETRSFALTVTAESSEQSPQTLHFTQEGGAEPVGVSFEISAASYEVGSEGGSVRVTVTAAAGVQWSAAFGGNADWIHFSGPSNGTGNGSITVRIQSNTAQESRSFALTVTAEGDQKTSKTLNFVQGASVSAVIAVTAHPADRSIPHTGGTVRLDISNSGGGRLNWTASTDVGWASVAGTASGTDKGSVVISVLENSGKARSFTVTVQSAGAENSPRTVRFAQAAAPEQLRDSARIHANKYALTHLGETVTVNINVTAEAQLNWTAEIRHADSTYVVIVPERDEEGMLTGQTMEDTRDRGEWVRMLGPSSGTGSGTLELQVDENPVALRWSFSLFIRFQDAPELDQTLHFSQNRDAEQRLMIWTSSRHIGAGGETVEVHVSASSGGLIYWAADVDVDWAHLEGAIDGEIDGNGTAVIRIQVDANPGDERSFSFSVNATDATSPQPILFRQAMAREMEGGDPMPPRPPAWYANDCQQQTPGFEEFGGWLAQRGHYLDVTDSRVWRHTTDGHDSNGATLRAFNDCTDDKRTLTTDILADAMLDEPAEFADLPRGADSRIVLLDISTPVVGEHTNGARHADPQYVWSDAGSGWYPTYTRDGDGLKFLHLQPLGDWGYESSSEWRSQLSEWNAAGSDMSAWTDTARDYGWRLPSIQERTGEGLRMLANADSSLWLLVGGYTGQGSGRRIHPNSAVCGEAKELCLFAPWEYQYTDEEGEAQTASGTAVAAAQVAAALDNVLLLWPDYDLLELRDLVLGCAEDLGDEGPDAMWGRGALSFNCLFTAQGELRDPRTDAILSGGIYGPLAGLYGGVLDAPVIAGGSIPGLDTTGRDFAYPLMRWSHRENHALLVATGNLGGSQAVYLPDGFGRTQGLGTALFARGGFTAGFAAAGDALGAAAQWRTGGFSKGTGLWTLRGGFAVQPEGTGSLTGERVFRAPVTLSSAISVAFQHSFTQKLSLHIQGNYWMTLNTQPRSLWAGAQLSELRASASLAYQSSRIRAELQAQYQGGLSGRLDVAGQKIHLMPHTARQMSLRVRIPLGNLQTQRRKEIR